MFTKKQAETLYIFFSWTRQAKKLKLLAHIQKVLIWLLWPSKNLFIAWQNLFKGRVQQDYLNLGVFLTLFSFTRIDRNYYCYLLNRVKRKCCFQFRQFGGILTKFLFRKILSTLWQKCFRPIQFFPKRKNFAKIYEIFLSRVYFRGKNQVTQFF